MGNSVRNLMGSLVRNLPLINQVGSGGLSWGLLLVRHLWKQYLRASAILSFAPY